MVVDVQVRQHDINTAKLLVFWANEFSTIDSKRVEERLFRMTDDRLFLHIARGAFGAQSNEFKILDQDEAGEWAKNRCDANMFRRIFGKDLGSE